MVKILKIVLKALHILFHSFKSLLQHWKFVRDFGSWQMSFQFTKKGARMILKTTGLFHLHV